MPILSKNSRIISTNGRILTWDTFQFSSIQTAILNQVTIIYRINTGKTVYLDWGVGSPILLTANNSDVVVTSTYINNNTTYTVKFYGNLKDITVFYINTEITVCNLNINDFGTKLTGLTYLYLKTLGSNITGSISSLPIGLTYLQLNNLGTSLTGSISSLPAGLTTLYLSALGTSLTGSISSLPAGLTYIYISSTGLNYTGSINSLSTNLTYLYLETVGTNITGSISSLPTGLTTLFLRRMGTNIDITSGTMPAWANATITITSGYLTAAVDGFLNAWAASVTGTTIKTIDLTGSGAGIANQARSAASDDAVTHLQDVHMKIIQTNP